MDVSRDDLERLEFAAAFGEWLQKGFLHRQAELAKVGESPEHVVIEIPIRWPDREAPTDRGAA